jgi:hypothetical protein
MSIVSRIKAASGARVRYLLTGGLAFVVWHATLRWLVLTKLSIDSFSFFWWEYVRRLVEPGEFARLGSSGPIAIGVIVVAAGVCFYCTARRLRQVDWPLPLLLLLLVPMVDLGFMAVLILASLPSDDDARPTTGLSLWAKTFGRADRTTAVIVLVTAAASIPTILLSTNGYGNYGFALFVAAPFLQGFADGLFYNDRGQQGLLGTVMVTLMSLGLTAILLVAFAIEGLICVVMAAPIAIALGLIGAALGWLLSGRYRPRATSVLPALAILTPGMFVAEDAVMPNAPVFESTSTIEINASPQVVWDEMVSFPELPAPKNWFFRVGIAYPTHARIEGSGVGATRYCDLSTGPIVEPVEIWDEPRRLRFSVVSNPPAMVEMSPYKEIRPPHLEGFMEAKAGEFRLVELVDGRTRLEGTSWYSHSLWPTAYWTVWSDQIVRGVHKRVFENIKMRAELAAGESAGDGLTTVVPTLRDYSASSDDSQRR